MERPLPNHQKQPLFLWWLGTRLGTPHQQYQHHESSKASPPVQEPSSPGSRTWAATGTEQNWWCGRNRSRPRTNPNETLRDRWPAHGAMESRAVVNPMGVQPQRISAAPNWWCCLATSTLRTGTHICSWPLEQVLSKIAPTTCAQYVVELGRIKNPWSCFFLDILMHCLKHLLSTFMS